MRRDVVILGAGPAGSSLAAVLGKLGWDVVLLERRNFPHHKVCGEFLSPESQASLQAMALYPSVATLKPALIAQARLVSPAGIVVQTALPGCAWASADLHSTRPWQPPPNNAALNYALISPPQPSNKPMVGLR